MTRGIWWVNGALLLVTGLALCSGCGSSPAPVVSNPPTQPTPQVTPGLPGTPTQPPPTVTPTPPESSIPVPVIPGAPAESTPPGLPTLPDPPATPTETVKADVGVSKEGRSLDNLQGPFAAEARAYFGVREKVTFQIKIPDAYNKYKAVNDVPLTFDEFKEKVLDPNLIKLPPLPPSHTYEWDPEKEELMVRRPAK